ncbi:MAG TPA: hypothetical protein VF486_13175 [Actinomycetes bacterium]
MIDDDEAERPGTGEHDEATGDPAASVSSADLPSPAADGQPPGGGQARDEGRVADHRPATDDDGLGAGGELEVAAEDVRLGEAERALLEWALRQRQSGPGEPLLRFPKVRLEAEAPPEAEATGEVAPEPSSEWAPDPEPGAPPAPPGEESRWPWERLYSSAEEAITALVAAGGPDPRDFASPRLTRRAKALIALALVVLFVVSALGGFVGYRLTHQAAGSGPAVVGRLAEVRGGTV